MLKICSVGQFVKFSEKENLKKNHFGTSVECFIWYSQFKMYKQFVC